MRLIDADILAEEIKSLKISIAGNPATWGEAKSDVLLVIDEQKTVDAADVMRGMWISVEERLPDENENCLFISSANNSVYIGRYIRTGKKGAVKFEKRDGRGTVLYTASHWMLLPEPPEEDKP